MLGFYRQMIEFYLALGWPARIALTVGVPTLTFIFGVWLVIWLPSDYFLRSNRPTGFWGRHVLLRALVRIVKNLLGLVIFPLGVFMALPLVPGPGLAFMLIGISLLEFPGKRRIERRLLSYPRILHAINQMRDRFRKQPMLVPPECGPSHKS